MTSALTAKLHLPTQELDAPTLFAPNSNALTAWLEQLPKANLGQTTRTLYNAVTELNHVRLNPALRLQLLEVLRPMVHFASNGLNRHYLNQPIQLPEQPLKVAQLAHALHTQLAIGYALAAVQMTALGKSGLNASQQNVAVATAVHRAIAEHSQNLLRDLLLYRSPHPGCWQTIHQLAKFARDNNLPDNVIADPQGSDSSIENAYLRALLIGGARTNQLRQESISRVFERALGWAAAASLADSDRGALVVNENTDDGPIYREYVDCGNEPGWHGIDASYLIRELAGQREKAEADAVSDPLMTPELLTHLAQAWSSASSREFLRTAVNEPVEISVGLTATHHFISGGIDFQILLRDNGHQRLAVQEENPFLRPRPTTQTQRSPKDVWDSPFAPRAGVVNVSLEILEYEMREQHQKTHSLKERDKFRSEAAERINISPGGLCITWPPQSKVLLRSGEIVGVRETNQKSWSIGVIRWSQLTEAGPRLGIELLSPSAVSYGARVINKTSAQGEYLRVLVLPEVKQIQQPTTLIAPRLPFRVGQKVSLLHRNKETRVQLTRKFAATAAFNQFEFRRLSTAPTETKTGEPAPNSSASGFDNLWDSL